MKNFCHLPNSVNVLLRIVLSVAAINLLISLFLPPVRWETVPFHSTIEALGALTALAMAIFLLMIRRDQNDQAHHVWVAAGLIGMGLLDGFHASVLPGHCFVWLHSTATLTGGILFTLTWLPDRFARTRWAEAFPWGAAIATAIFGTMSIAFQPLFPLMISRDEFTAAAKIINLLGGVFFLTAMVRFSLRHQKDKAGDNLVFAGLCLLFGSAGLLFTVSEVWQLDWWLWHFVRLSAYFVALGYVFTVFRRAEAEYRTIIQTSLDGLLVIDFSGQIYEANEASCRMLGYTREELLRLSVSDIDTVEAPEETAAHIQKIIHTGNDRFLTRHRRKDGALIDVEASARYVSALGECFFVFLQDITERKRAEQTHLRLIERMAALLALSTSTESEEETLLQQGLDVMQHLTDSRIAFLHFINEDQKEVDLVTWSTETLNNHCQAAFDRHYPLEAAGIWVNCVASQQPVIINDYPAASGKKGLPVGHAPLQRFLSVPIVENAQVRMIAGVGNAARDYNEHDVETIKLFSYDLYRIVQRQREKQKLYERGQELLFRNRIAEIFLTHNYDQIFTEILKVLLEATGSQYGIFGYLNDAGALVVPSMTQEIWDKCQIYGKTHIFPKNTWSNSSWPRALREKRTIWANEPACEMPEGHLSINRHVSMPIMFQDKAIGLFQVANKAIDYTETDILTMEALTRYLAPLLHARLEGKRAEDLVTGVLDSIDEGFIIINRDFKIISSNRAYAESVGKPLGEIVDQHCYKISHHIDWPCYLNGEDCAVKHVFDTGESHITLHTHYDTNNNPIYVETRAFALSKNELAEVQTVIEIVVDITEKKHREEEIHLLAFYDPLTSLPNRRLLLDRLEQAFIASSRNGQYNAVLFLDLDHFKTLNDTRGHAIGDLLLVEVARHLQKIVREGDTVSRQGGDEFVVLLKNLSEEKQVAITQAGHVAEKIRADLCQPFMLANHEQHITASIGISLFCGHNTTLEELFKQADTAMYQAKHAGRNTVRFFDPAMQATLEEASALETDLRQAISSQQFTLHYQPQTDGNGRIIGAEALLRWTHPDRGQISPMAFIPVAEETGLILPIGRWVLEEACAQLKAWSDITPANNLRLAINVSARQFRQPDFVEEVRQVITATGVNPARLKIELTESLVLADITDTIAKMQLLGNMGIGFSIDDFGTGFSSLSQLKRLPLEQLKIDRSFIHDLGTGPHDAAIVKTIIAMGRTLGFHIIAEGVETEEQLSFLIRSGCHAYQGYLFSRPVPAADFERLLVAGVIARKP